jgi:RNA polymerase sigma-70 factor (ECF subfamily)
MMKTNEEWLRALRADGIEQDDALKDLRETILRAMRAYLAADSGYRSAFRSEEVGQIAEDCAQETLLTIRQKIDTFKGESRFTTWATAIAIRILLGELRRRRWKQLSIQQSRIGHDLPKRPIETLQSRDPDPELALQQDEIWRNLTTIIEEELTARQRYVLIASVFQGMPLDLVADRLGTNRDNVYKVLHDARKKLKTCLSKRGLSQQEILRIFQIRR